MKFTSPLKIVLAAVLLLASVLVSVTLWSNDAPDAGLPAQPTSTGDKSAIFTATPAPTATPTPIPSGTVVEIVYWCHIYLYAVDHFSLHSSLDPASGSTCVPPYPPDLIFRDADGEPLLHIEGPWLNITVREESGQLFQVGRPSPFAIAVGDRWPPD